LACRSHSSRRVLLRRAPHPRPRQRREIIVVRHRKHIRQRLGHRGQRLEPFRLRQLDIDFLIPVHPRTRQRIATFGIDVSQLDLREPLPYIEFLALQRRATAVVTDSGGIQEETTYLKVPCLTLRNNTERPVTVTMGTNILVGQDGTMLRAELAKILQGKQKQGTVPPLWDGHAGERIAAILSKL